MGLGYMIQFMKIEAKNPNSRAIAIPTVSLRRVVSVERSGITDEDAQEPRPLMNRVRDCC
jgi:hypothetical protein